MSNADISRSLTDKLSIVDKFFYKRLTIFPNYIATLFFDYDEIKTIISFRITLSSAAILTFIFGRYLSRCPQRLFTKH